MMSGLTHRKDCTYAQRLRKRNIKTIQTFHFNIDYITISFEYEGNPLKKASNKKFESSTPDVSLMAVTVMDVSGPSIERNLPRIARYLRVNDALTIL